MLLSAQDRICLPMALLIWMLIGMDLKNEITTSANARSFVGLDASHQFVMGTLSAATMADMAQVLLKLGLTDAMNMDGGASSSLYAGTVHAAKSGSGAQQCTCRGTSRSSTNPIRGKWTIRS